MFRSSCNLIVVCVLFRMLSNYLHTVWCSHFCYSKPACLLKVQVDQVQFPVTRTFRTVSKPLDKTLYLVDFKSRFYELNCATCPWPSMNVVITINFQVPSWCKITFRWNELNEIGRSQCTGFLDISKMNSKLPVISGSAIRLPKSSTTWTCKKGEARNDSTASAFI